MSALTVYSAESAIFPPERYVLDQATLQPLCYGKSTGGPGSLIQYKGEDRVMKNCLKKWVGFAAVLGALSTSAAWASPLGTVPDCSDAQKVLPNSWIIMLNQNDQADREDLLAALRTLATGGFAVESIIPVSVPGILLVTTFDPSYYGTDTAAALRARDGALGALAALNDTVIECNGRVESFLGITIRN